MDEKEKYEFKQSQQELTYSIRELTGAFSRHDIVLTKLEGAVERLTRDQISNAAKNGLIKFLWAAGGLLILGSLLGGLGYEIKINHETQNTVQLIEYRIDKLESKK